MHVESRAGESFDQPRFKSSLDKSGSLREYKRNVER